MSWLRALVPWELQADQVEDSTGVWKTASADTGCDSSLLKSTSKSTYKQIQGILLALRGGIDKPMALVPGTVLDLWETKPGPTWLPSVQMGLRDPCACRMFGSNGCFSATEG